MLEVNKVSAELECEKKRHIAEQSSTATPLLTRFHARTAHSTSLFADFALSLADETISTASLLEMTSQTWIKRE